VTLNTPFSESCIC